MTELAERSKAGTGIARMLDIGLGDWVSVIDKPKFAK